MKKQTEIIAYAVFMILKAALLAAAWAEPEMISIIPLAKLWQSQLDFQFL